MRRRGPVITAPGNGPPPETSVLGLPGHMNSSRRQASPAQSLFEIWRPNPRAHRYDEARQGGSGNGQGLTSFIASQELHPAPRNRAGRYPALSHLDHESALGMVKLIRS